MLHTLLYFLALISLSTAPIWAKLNQMPSEVLGFWRLTIAGTLLSLWVFVGKKNSLPRFEKKFLWVLASGFFFFAHLWSYKYAAKHTLIANMMILFATNPLWSTLGSILFFKEKMTTRLWISYFFGTTSVILLVYKQFQLGGPSFYGDLSALASAFLFSCYMLTGKKARTYYTNSIYATFQYLTCALFFLLVVLINEKNFTGYNEISWISVAGLIIFTTFFGHFISTYLISFMNLSLMSCGKLIEPVIAAFLAYLVFREHLTTEAIIAFILTSISLLILFAPNIFISTTKDKT